MSKQTLYNWRDKYILARNITKSQMRKTRQWNMKDKYNAVLEVSNLSDDKSDKWLGEKGLHSEHLTLWEMEIEIMVSSQKDKEETRVSTQLYASKVSLFSVSPIHGVR